MTSRQPYLCLKNNETVAMLVSQTSPVGVELFSYENTLSFVAINLHRCWSREWKRPVVITYFIFLQKAASDQVYHKVST